MRLKRLDLFGFKSFCERTSITFEAGTTAIVGPNGCGKSNISDAILWVLGEQSPRTLRGDRMEDVIFNGSEQRRPLGMAEVSLTLEEVEPAQDNALSRFREVTVTRRLFRSGESEYLINKAPCRLRDIRDLLMDLGASFKGHGILEQGKVDELVTASPLERRTIIEETAGITKYKVRKAEAERKLDATNQNLLRVRDIISEVKRQLNHLDRQAKKARSYQGLREEIRKLELRLSVQEGRTYSEALRHVEAEKAQLQTREAEFLAQRSRQEAEVEILRTQDLDRQKALEQMKQTLHEMEARALAAEHKIAAITAQQKDWQEETVHIEEEIRTLEQALVDGRQRLKEFAEQAQSLGTEIDKHRSQQSELEGRAHDLDLLIQQTQARVEEGRHGIFERQSAITQTKNSLTEGELKIAEIHKRIERASSQKEQLILEREANLGLAKDQEQLLSAHRKQIALLKETLKQDQIRLRSEQEMVREQESLLAEKRAEYQDKRVRHATLRDQLQAHTNLQEGARELLNLKGPDRLKGYHAVLADLLETPSRYEKAMEAVLRERLGGLVMDGRESIESALSAIKGKGGGDITLLPRLPRMNALERESLQQTQARVSILEESRGGVVGHALSFVKVREDFRQLLDALLQDVLIVEDAGTAFTLWADSSWGGTMVTLEGEVLESSGILYGHGGGKENKGLLEERRVLKNLEEAAGALEAEVSGLEQAGQAAARQLKALADQIETHQRRLHALELEEVQYTQKFEFLQQDLSRIEERLGLIELEQEQSHQEEKEILANLSRFSEALEQDARQNQALEASLEGQRRILDEHVAKKEILQKQRTEVRVALSGFQERHTHLALQQDQIKARLEEQEAQVQAKRQRLDQLATRRSGSERECEDLKQSMDRLSGERGILLSQIQTQTEAVNENRDRLKALESEHRLGQAELEEVQKAVRDIEVRTAETRMGLDRVREVIASLAHRSLEDALREMSDLNLEEGENRERLNEWKVKLEAMEPVNLAALDEHRELEERYEFLTCQEQDLTQAIDSLQKAIGKINQTMRALFMETFEMLNAKFSETFVQFFEGGSARLILVDEHNALDSGLEIVAQPPGKRLRHIQLLSGGEKALTAISLLFSSFLIQPGPFCVLDEIDAALDEENVRRFTRVLRTLADRSQFILVTHNKRTMEMADVLYGVTMEEPGSSKVVSVKLAEMAGQPAG